MNRTTLTLMHPPTNRARKTVLTGGGLVAFLALARTSMDTFVSMLMAMLPTLQERFRLTETSLALLVAAL